MIDKGLRRNWSRKERAARAFENYVIHKMTQKGYQNDYLANVVRIEEFQRDAGRYPYLLDSEVAPVAEAFDGLFSTIKTRETDRGVAMYSPAFPLDTAAPAGDIPTTSKEIVHADQWQEKDPAREDAFRRARARNPRVVLAEARSALDRGRQAARRGDYGGTGAPLAAALDKSTLDSTAYLRPENLDYAARLRSYGYTAVFVRNPGLRPIDGVTITGGGNNFVLLYTDAARSHELFHILELAGDADALALRDAVDLSAEEAVGYGEALARRGFSLSSYDLQSEIAAVVFSRGGGFGIPLEQAVRAGARAGQGRAAAEGPRYAVGSPMWYSALERAVEAQRQETFTADQLRAVLSKTPGVKAEEMADTGLGDWLDAATKDKRKVTKAEALEFLRANQAEVREVVKGSGFSRDNLSDAAKAAYDGYVARGALDNINLLMPSERRDWQQLLDKGQGYTEFERYQLPGGRNYRELLLTMPDATPPKGTSKPQWLIDTGRAANMTEAVRLSDSRTFDNEWASAQRANFTSSHFPEPNILAHVRFNERTDADGKRVLFIEEVQSDWHQKGRRGV